MNPIQKGNINQTITPPPIDQEYRINNAQVKNPVWKTCKVPTSVDPSQVADFILQDARVSILFLSLRYYYEFPLYLKAKIDDFHKSQDYKNYPNRILLLLNDKKDLNDYMTDIVQIC